MMMKIDEIVGRLISNAEAIRRLLETLTDEQSNWKPDPETWSMKEVMEHVFNEERLDFRKHLREMLSEPPQPWGQFHQEDYLTVESCKKALEEFLLERQASTEWLKEQAGTDWTVSSSISFSPEGETFVLSAGDVLVSWVAHDFLHLRQMNELLYAWNEKQAPPYSVQYAGGW
jgi:hypothetical protein